MIEKLNKRKKKVEVTYKYPAFVCIGFGMVLHISLTHQIGPVGFALFFIGIILMMVAASKLNAISKEYKNKYFLDLLNEEFDSVSYTADGKIAKQNFYDAEFGMTGNRFSTNDHIEATYNGVNFSLCDILLRHKTGSGKHQRTVTRFKGLFLKIDFDKAELGKLQVLESSRNVWFNDYDSVEMESIAFNEVFNVYSTNEHLAFYVLTPSMMERLMLIEEKNNGKFYFSFINGVLYIGLYDNVDNFEIGSGDITEYTIEKFRSQLRMIQEIINDIKLLER